MKHFVIIHQHHFFAEFGAVQRRVNLVDLEKRMLKHTPFLVPIGVDTAEIRPSEAGPTPPAPARLPLLLQVAIDRFQRDKRDPSVIVFSDLQRCQLPHSTQFFQKAKNVAPGLEASRCDALVVRYGP